MNLSKEQHEEIYQHLAKIAEMRINEIIAFEEKLYFNREDMDDKVFNFVKRGTTSQMAILMEIDSVSPMAVMDEIGETREEDR